MSRNNSQIGNTPSEPLLENRNNQLVVPEILSSEIIPSDQSVAQFNTTNMIPTEIPIAPRNQRNNDVSRRREGRRLRHQRRRQRRREQQNHFRQQQSTQIREQYHQRQQERPLENQQRQVLYLPWYSHRYERQQMYQFDIHGRLYRPAEDWEEEQLNEMEGFAILEQLALAQDNIEQEQQIDAEQKIIFDEEQEQCQNYEKSIEYEQNHDSIQDDIEQSRHIDITQEIIEEEHNERNIEELVQYELWEEAAFLIQQLNHY